MQEDIKENQDAPQQRRRTDIPPKSKILRFLRRDVSKRTSAIVLVIYFALSFFYYGFIKPPVLFPTRKIISLEEGMSLKRASEFLVEEKVVRSSLWLRNFVILYSGEKSIIAGDYYFDEPVSVFTVAHRITDKNYRMAPLRITVPEGYNLKEMSDTFSIFLNRFNKEAFIEKTKDKEGRLFPDTYFFLPTASEEVVIATMQDNFEQKTKDLVTLSDQIGKDFDDVLKMASILELEGNDKESREIISGILWKRIKMGMPLQVDASFAYLLNKGTSEITVKDLGLDSPYNSYKYKGLPPTPISNPGMESILAALYPKESPFLYYLSDKDGEMHYAKDFEEHKKNRVLYQN